MTTQGPSDEQVKQQIDDGVACFASAFTGLADPTARARALTALLDAVPAMQAIIRAARQDAVLELRRDGMSHAGVAAALGVSRSRAQQIAEGRSRGSTPPADRT